MNRKYYILFWVAITCFSMFLVPAYKAEASLGDIVTTCRVYQRYGHTVSAANHPNGLIYVAVSDADGVGETFIRNRARMVVRAVDPLAVKHGGDCSDTQFRSTEYIDTDSYTTYHVLVTPTIARSDAAGNVYIGKITRDGFRLLYIPASAPKSNPYAGMKITTVTGLSGPLFTMGGMAVTNQHVLMGTVAYQDGKELYGYYSVITNAQAEAGGTISGNWQLMSNQPVYGPQYSAIDSFAGLPNGRFFIGGSFKHSGPAFIALGGFLDPATLTITGINGSMGKLDPFPCSRSMLGIVPFGCFYPSAQMGDDGKLYVSYGSGENTNSGSSIRYNFITYYDFTQNRWENLSGAPAPALTTRIPQFSGLQASGLGKFIDSTGKVYAAGTNYVSGPLTLAAYENGAWNNRGFNIPQVEFGKPQLIVSQFNGGLRLSVFYVSLTDGDVYWTTYTSTFSNASCEASVSLENGATAVSGTSVLGSITMSNECTATKYVARVTRTSAKPTTDPSAGEFKRFTRANPVFSVGGLAVNTTNFVHVRLYDNSNRPISAWITNRMISDTSTTVGVTASLRSQQDTPGFLDLSTEQGSSFADELYTRSLVAQFTISNITDLSGLSTFQFSGSNERTYVNSMLNQPIRVFLQQTGTANQVGTTVRLTDRAGNVEDRAMTLIYDVEPPTVTAPPTVAFTPSFAESFEGEFTLSGGTITDNLYPGGYWGVWVASEKVTGPADDTRSTLKWGAVEVTGGKFDWNLLNGLDELTASGNYRIYVKFLDGAGNPSTTSINQDFTVTYTDTDYELFVPYITVQR